MAIWVSMGFPFSFVRLDLYSGIGSLVSFMWHGPWFKEWSALPRVQSTRLMVLFVFVMGRSLFVKAADLNTTKHLDLFHACDYICNSCHVDYREKDSI